MSRTMPFHYVHDEVRDVHVFSVENPAGATGGMAAVPGATVTADPDLHRWDYGAPRLPARVFAVSESNPLDFAAFANAEAASGNGFRVVPGRWIVVHNWSEYLEKMA